MAADFEVRDVASLVEQGVLQIGDGYRAKNIELASDGLPFARAGNLKDGFSFESADRVPPTTLARVGDKRSRVGDVVFTSKGTVGRFGYVDTQVEPFVFSPQLCFWRSLRTDELDPRFLFFWFHGIECREQLTVRKGQTDMADYVSLRDQRSMRVTFPPIASQRAIAAVLGALDDKIASNARLARLARQTAKREFNRATAGATEGPVPFVDLVDVIPGRSYKSSELMAAGATALVTLKSISPGGGYQPGGLKPYSGTFRPAQVVAPGEVVVAVTDLTQAANVVGQAARVPLDPRFETLVASLDLVVVRPRRAHWSSYLLGLLQSRPWLQQAFGYANGSTVLHLNKRAFAEFLIREPEAELVNALANLCDPLYSLADGLDSESTALTAIRDALLPKLVSGQIRVPLSNDSAESLGAAVEALNGAAP